MRSKFANLIEWAFAVKDKIVLITMPPMYVKNISILVSDQTRDIVKDIPENASISKKVNVNGTQNANISTKLEIKLKKMTKTTTKRT